MGHSSSPVFWATKMACLTAQKFRISCWNQFQACDWWRFAPVSLQSKRLSHSHRPLGDATSKNPTLLILTWLCGCACLPKKNTRTFLFCLLFQYINPLTADIVVSIFEGQILGLLTGDFLFCFSSLQGKLYNPKSWEIHDVFLLQSTCPILKRKSAPVQKCVYHHYLHLFTTFKPAGFQHKHLQIGYDCLTRISWVKKTVWRLEEVILGRTKDEEVSHRKTTPWPCRAWTMWPERKWPWSSQTRMAPEIRYTDRLEMSSIVDECDAPW